METNARPAGLSAARKKWMFCAMIFTDALILDQFTKYLAHTRLADGSVELLPFFNFSLVYNKGISFGMFNSLPGPALLIAFACLMVAALCAWLWREQKRSVCYALAFIISGATGNIIDRARLGAVIDFLDFHIGDWHYPSFNIADSCIVLGIAFLLWDSLFSKTVNKDLERHEETPSA